MGVNELIATKVFTKPEAPRDAWALGKVSGTPTATTANVILDGDSTATSMALACACHDGDQVLTLLLGRSRIVTHAIGNPCPHPVGGFFLSKVNTSPSAYWPGTTWAAFGTGRALVGVDPNDADFHEAGHTGGHKALQAHTHTYTYSPFAGVSMPWNTGGYPNGVYGQASGTSGSTGTGDSGNLQPYVCLYVWERTA